MASFGWFLGKSNLSSKHRCGRSTVASLDHCRYYLQFFVSVATKYFFNTFSLYHPLPRQNCLFENLKWHQKSGCFAISGSLIALFVCDISPSGFFVTNEESGILVDGWLPPSAHHLWNSWKCLLKYSSSNISCQISLDKIFLVKFFLSKYFFATYSSTQHSRDSPTGSASRLSLSSLTLTLTLTSLPGCHFHHRQEAAKLWPAGSNTPPRKLCWSPTNEPLGILPGGLSCLWLPAQPAQPPGRRVAVARMHPSPCCLPLQNSCLTTCSGGGRGKRYPWEEGKYWIGHFADRIGIGACGELGGVGVKWIRWKNLEI